MTCVRFGNPRAKGFLCLSSSQDYWIIDAQARTWMFEWHRYMGPIALNKKTGDPLEKEPGPRSPFWDAVTKWDQQGRKTKKGLKGRDYAVWSKECRHRWFKVRDKEGRERLLCSWCDKLKSTEESKSESE